MYLLENSSSIIFCGLPSKMAYIDRKRKTIIAATRCCAMCYVLFFYH